MTIFNGYQFAQEREARLKHEVDQLGSDQTPSVAAILFQEDQGSQLYTKLKKEAAERVGITYQVFTFSMRDPVTEVLEQLTVLNQDPSITGIIIQKPWRKSWQSITGGNVEDFNEWWHTLTQAIALHKDVDGLHPQTLVAIKNNTWEQEGRVLPATCKAVLEILTTQNALQPEKKVIILGKSDILGQPLFYQLQNLHLDVEMIGSQELQARRESGALLLDADIIVSATGRQQLITGELLSVGVTVVDVGEPRPDVDFTSVATKASFLTPVPGGVGPVTVVCLLENTLQLFNQ
jgi:methylenetetrahydrofolate dehydrogenase (NADP+)/methenyltetrahydrofolate cyclohydrolase